MFNSKYLQAHIVTQDWTGRSIAAHQLCVDEISLDITTHAPSISQYIFTADRDNANEQQTLMLATADTIMARSCFGISTEIAPTFCTTNTVFLFFYAMIQVPPTFPIPGTPSQ